MTKAHHESLKVMQDMTHAMNCLVAAMENSNLDFGGSEVSLGNMKLSKDEGDVVMQRWLAQFHNLRGRGGTTHESTIGSMDE